MVLEMRILTLSTHFFFAFQFFFRLDAGADPEIQKEGAESPPQFE